MIIKAMSRECTIKTQVTARKGRICRCHLLDHQNWFLVRPLDDPLLIVPIHPAIHLTSNEKCIVVALHLLEDGGTTAKYLNMAMEVRLLILIEWGVSVCHQGGAKGNRSRIGKINVEPSHVEP
jgi:hypothetical protein